MTSLNERRALSCLSAAGLGALLWLSAAASAYLPSASSEKLATAETSAPSAAIRKVAGDVSALLDGLTPWIEARAGLPLTPGTKIRSRPGASALVAFDDGSTLELGGDASLKIETLTDQDVSVYLARGALKTTVSRDESRAFTLRTPVLVATAQGAVFDMDVTRPTRCVVQLRSGTLEATDTFGRRTILAAGRRLEVDAADGPAPAEAPPLGALKSLDLQ